jgi:UDP-N-acetylenolpyruvoylglucosamine reductase
MSLDLIGYLNENTICFEENVNLSLRTWIHRGGIAKIFIIPSSSKELEQVCHFLYENKYDFLILGHTSNLYIHNEYNPEIVVSTKMCNSYNEGEDYVECECGVSVVKLAKYYLCEGYSGLEYLTELPGTIAAALHNNSSCKENSVSALLISANVLVANGTIETWMPTDFQFSFRGSCLKSGFRRGVIISAKLKKIRGDKDALQKIAKSNKQDREERLEGPRQNLGCTFNRPFSNEKMSFLYKTSTILFTSLLRLLMIKEAHRQKIEKKFLLSITGYRDLCPYISDFNLITFIWSDSKADEKFPRYVEFMHNVMKTDSVEIQEIKARKKINLLTIHWGNSYGAILQTYASVKLIEEIGCEVTLIDLVHPKVHKNKDFIKLWWITNYRFHKFLKENISSKTKQMYRIKPDFIPLADCTIIGSDQVWNKDITTILSLNYFLDFARNKRIALSSSFGKHFWDESEEYTALVNNELKQFSAISVREASGVDICKNVFNKEAVHLIDPTLAYGYFNNFVNRNILKKYILVFLMIETPETDQISSYVSNKLSLKICQPGRITLRLFGGPCDWLRRMSAASFVITSSFHGLAFALLFKKNFIVLCADEHKFCRLSSLLNHFGLSNRYVKSYEDLKSRPEILFENINYTKVDEILSFEQDKAREFLKAAIKQN